MSISSCIDTLVSNAKITAQQGRDAKAIYEGHLNDDLFRDMGQAEKEAAAALRTAKYLTEDARNRKLAVKFQVNKWRENVQRIEQHPVRPFAGHNSLYARDLAGHGGVNLEGIQTGYYQPKLASKMSEFTKAYEPKLAGLKQDVNGIRNFILERLGGVDTGDQIARITAKAYGEMSDFADKEGVRLDPRFRPDPENKLPQYHESSRAMKFGAAEHKADIYKQINSGGLKIFDKDTNSLAKDDATREKIVDRAIKDIRMDLSHFGESDVMSDFSRTFRFTNDEAGAKSYLALMDKYGAGEHGYFSMIQAHVGGLARVLALKRQFGPNYQIATQHLLDYARKLDAERVQAPGGEEMRTWLTGATAAKMLQQMATGQLSAVESKLVKSIFDGARGFVTSTKLGSALITAMPTDSYNTVMASSLYGLDTGRLLSSIVRNFLSSGNELQGIAARLGMTAHSAALNALGVKRFGDQLFGEKFFQRLGSFVVHAQGLAHWDNTLKTVFPMEFLASLGDRAGKSFGELDGAFARFIKDYGFTESEWEKIAAAEHIDGPAGTKYLLPSSLDEPLQIKLLSAIADARQFGYVVGGSMRGRALATGGMKAGTILGEAARSTFLFRNYPVTMAMTHLMAAFREARQGRFAQMAHLIIGMTIMGAMTLQARALLYGKDPRDMTKPLFWGEASVQGSVAGVWSDFLSQAFGRSETSLVETALGPLATIPTGIEALLSPARRAAIEGEKVNWGSQLAKFLKANAPGNNVWYLRLLFERYVIDSVRRLVDPNYAQSFRREQQRQEKLYGQKFYWRPGELAPSRPPNPRAAIGGR